MKMRLRFRMFVLVLIALSFVGDYSLRFSLWLFTCAVFVFVRERAGHYRLYDANGNAYVDYLSLGYSIPIAMQGIAYLLMYLGYPNATVMDIFMSSVVATTILSICRAENGRFVTWLSYVVDKAVEWIKLAKN